MDYIIFKDKDGKVCFILAEEMTEPQPVDAGKMSEEAKKEEKDEE